VERAAERQGPVLDGHRAARQVEAALIAPALVGIRGDDRPSHRLIGEDLVRFERHAERDHVQRVAHAVGRLPGEVDIHH